MLAFTQLVLHALERRDVEAEGEHVRDDAVLIEDRNLGRPQHQVAALLVRIGDLVERQSFPGRKNLSIALIGPAAEEIAEGLLRCPSDHRFGFGSPPLEVVAIRDAIAQLAILDVQRAR